MNARGGALGAFCKEPKFIFISPLFLLWNCIFIPLHSTLFFSVALIITLTAELGVKGASPQFSLFQACSQEIMKSLCE